MFFILLGAAVVCAQTVNGVVSGRIIDPGGLGIPGANVTITRAGTGESRQLTTPDTGDFVFTSMLPGSYSITVQASGMRRLQERGVQLTASERLELGNLQLQLGALSDTITVTAESTPVQTGSAERSAVLTNTQIESLNTRARQYLDLLKVLPGVAYDVPSGLGSQDMLGITQGPKVQGLRGEYNTFQTDGLFMNDLGTKDTLYNPTNMDAISEVKVLLNNYQAEYGHAGGAIINAVTKSGTRDFRLMPRESET
jgi:carboxypeptidase family protein/TonB-dependent receptor-like protein